MIDARSATGVPCITTCPVIMPRGFLVATGIELHEWQEEVLRGHGFIIADGGG